MDNSLVCPRCGEKLVQVYTRRGVVVDICPNGHGVWMDGGEIYFFVDDPAALKKSLEGGLAEGLPVKIECLRCRGKEMQNGRPVSGAPVVDMCPCCGGMWLDRSELGALNAALGSSLDPYQEIMQDHKRAARTGAESGPEKGSGPSVSGGAVQRRRAAEAVVAAASLNPLPNLALSSMSVLGLLYALVFAILVMATTYMGVGIHVAFAVAVAIILLQYLVSPFLMDLMLSWLYSMKWISLSELPPRLAQFIEDTCGKNSMPCPRVGLIYDGNPNAFTYGHTPRNARVIITRGLLELLDEDEVEAVVAHEIGHARHWDILFMTLAGLVPVVFYYIYRVIVSSGSKSSGGGKGKGQLMMVGLASYILYIISQYVVLYLSRTREYYADRFSGEATGSPNTLATGLVKVAYGLAGAEKKKDKEGDKRNPAVNSLKAFGIFDPSAAQSLAVSSSRGGEMNVENAIGAMQWDLWNPWGTFYELNSTHPLPAKRIQALGDQASAYGQQPAIRFNLKRPESYWDEFLVDVLVLFAPFIGAALGALAGLAAAPVMLPGFALLGMGAGYAFNLLFSYRAKEFLPMKVAAMLRKVKVSNVRPVPVTIEGKVIGRGVPGLIYSEDVVVQDETGFIFVDYRQPLRIIEFLFGLFRTNKFIGRDAKITGWYRRAPIPYIEVRYLEVDGNRHTSYIFAVKWIVAVILLIAGAAVSAGALQLL